MPIPIPAMPNPLIINKVKSNQGLVIKPVLTATSGAKKAVNIVMVLTIMSPLPYLLRLLVLKYSLIRILNALENSEPVVSINFGFLILFVFGQKKTKIDFYIKGRNCDDE